MEIEELKLLEVKDRILVIKSDNLNANSLGEVRKKMFERGCLGVIAINTKSDISVLGLKELESIVKQIKERKQDEGQ
jgi:hypothetical protein